MKKLLSLPPNLVESFHRIEGASSEEWFCTHDPIGHKLGSGGGSVWLLDQCWREEQTGLTFDEWLPREKRLLLHAGGQSRRLPAYAPSGKILTPIPVFRWGRGQRLSQDLLSLQVPLYNRILDAAPDSLHTLIVSGDVYIRCTEPLQPIPDVDVVCYGLWLDAETASHHGVFVADRQSPAVLKQMLQKPDVATLAALLEHHFYLTDIGVWLLSDKAVRVLREKTSRDGEWSNYDLYATFGGALGTHPVAPDPEVSALSVAILPLPGGEFYHFGTSHELVSSMMAIQNRVNDQRRIMHNSVKPHPSMFTQNTEMWIRLTEENQCLWVENSCISEHWTLSHHHVITGVPENDWRIELRPGQCVDLVPIGESQWAVRPYGYDDLFRGDLTHDDTCFLGMPFRKWAEERRIDISSIKGAADMQTAEIFPVVDNMNDAGLVLRWMLNESYQQGGRMLWNMSRRISADGISNEANLLRLQAQRVENRAKIWPFLARNYRHSVFYQIDLKEAACEFASANIAQPDPLPDSEPVLTRMHDAMFRSELLRLKGRDGEQEASDRAFALLREGVLGRAQLDGQRPRLSVYNDQIVWARSPVRIDLAGGWTDTPPYCLMEGGSVVNIAVELNGQLPIQAYVKPCREPHVILRSIDLGASETIDSYEQLTDFNKVGSPFSIPKAALVLAGFHPQFAAMPYGSLQSQLKDFGCGLEITMLCAIPAGSGLGTSSLLAATILGALNDFCGLMWDRNEIGYRTLALEQLLTTGGGWQDQFGGLLQGVKWLQTEAGFTQNPMARYLSPDIFTQTDLRACHLLYYTGITRTAKNILSEIVRRMFLNDHHDLALLAEMKNHAHDMYEAIQRNDFGRMGRLVGRTWQQNQALDEGTNPPEINQLTQLVDDYCLGYKLPGAGGGGYLYMVAKDPDAAVRIRSILNARQQHENARFVDMSLSTTGLQVSRS